MDKRGRVKKVDNHLTQKIRIGRFRLMITRYHITLPNPSTEKTRDGFFMPVLPVPQNYSRNQGPGYFFGKQLLIINTEAVKPLSPNLKIKDFTPRNGLAYVL